MWVLGLSRDIWPQDASPNPFIPLDIQKKYDTPRSSAQRELKIAKKITATLTRGAVEQIIFSFPKMVDEVCMQASPLIDKFTAISVDDLAIRLPVNNKQQNIKLEEQVELCGVEFNSQAAVKGGARILQLQNACPFRAYAEFRLKAKPLKIPSNYLQASEKGEIVHKVMAKFWRYMQNLDKLRQYTKPQLLSILAEMLDKELRQWEYYKPNTLSAIYKKIEKNRLLFLLSAWLELEKERANFIVTAIEEDSTVQIGPLLINLRVDRIDQIGSNDYVILDYKTGKVRVNDWQGEDVKDLQLPLYSLLLSDEQLAGVAAACISIKDMKFQGMCAKGDLLPQQKVITNWHKQLQLWKNKILEIANDFAAGKSQVAPKQGAVTCRYCNLHSLCRIFD